MWDTSVCEFYEYKVAILASRPYRLAARLISVPNMRTLILRRDFINEQFCLTAANQLTKFITIGVLLEYAYDYKPYLPSNLAGWGVHDI